MNHTPRYPCSRAPSMWIWAVLGSPMKHSKGTLYNFRSWVIRNFAACLMLLESFIWEKSAVMSTLNTLDLHAVRKLQLTMWRSCMDRERRPAIPSYSSTQAEVPDGEQRCHLGHSTQSNLHVTSHLTTQRERPQVKITRMTSLNSTIKGNSDCYKLLNWGQYVTQQWITSTP